MIEAPKPRIPLADARKLAARIVHALLPFCERIEIAGSIRRQRPTVGDIDIVLMPKDGQLAALKDRCRQNCDVITDGAQNYILQMRSTQSASNPQVDIWIARRATRGLFSEEKTNFGSLLLCRTGSTDHNIYLVGLAKRLGLIWSPYSGVFRRDELIASETEDDIFTALGLPFLKPELRECEYGLPQWQREDATTPKPFRAEAT